MTLCGHSLCWVYVCAGQRISLLWRETQTKGLSSRSPARPEVDEETEVPEKTKGQLIKEDGESQLTSEGRVGQSADRAVSRRRQEKMEAGQWRQSTEVSMASGFRRSYTKKKKKKKKKKKAQSTVAIVSKCTENAKCHRLSPSCTWSWPKSVFVRLFFFFHPLGCILYGRKEMCDTPVGNHWMNHWPWIVLV